MTDFTTPRTWNIGELITKAMMDVHVRDNFNATWVGTTAGDMDYYVSSIRKSRLPIGTEYQFLQVNPAGNAPQWGGLQWCSAYHNTTQTVNNGTPTALAFNSDVELNTPGWHDGSTNNTRITVAKTGYYHAAWNFDYAGAGGSGNYWDTVSVKQNGSTMLCQDRKLQQVDAFSKIFCSSTPIFFLTAGDYVELILEQNSGGTRTVSSLPRFTLTRDG